MDEEWRLLERERECRRASAYQRLLFAAQGMARCIALADAGNRINDPDYWLDDLVEAWRKAGES